MTRATSRIWDSKWQNCPSIRSYPKYLRRKAADFKNNLKMGRTQLQDAIGTT